MFELDFSEHHAETKSLSLEDKKFLSILENKLPSMKGDTKCLCHFVILCPRLPNNREMVLQHLQGYFYRDWSYHYQYSKFIKKLIDKEHAKKLTKEDMGENKHVWYLPHGVYHPRKPGKLYVVFDGSARYISQSLNELLLQGPDFINSLCGVLCRFHKEPVAFVCDIEQMFLQV